MKLNAIFNLENTWLIRILFGLFFLYVVLRAIFVTPLLDEIGTLHWFIQTGNIINDQAVLDANNHLLNSLFSHYSFRLFGDHLLAYRLLAIISFPIYFFSARKLVKENIKQFAFLVFLALVSIHWMFDYFSLSRGYAPSVAFFMLGLSYISTWIKEKKSRYFGLMLGSFVFCLCSNLSMFVPVLLLFGYLHLTLILQWKLHPLKSKIISYFISLGFLFIAYKLYRYVSKLKAAGALWWGSDNGLWQVTGKSVSENVVFTDSDYLLYGFLLLFILLTAAVVHLLIKKGWKELLLSLPFQSYTLFLLSLVSIELMVKIMDVNYPEDRVAMYLVLLLILSIGSVLAEVRHLKWAVLILLWFPITFIAKINLNTTVFSPQDRIHNSFYKEIQKRIGPNDVLTADYVAHLSYSYATRQDPNQKMAVLNDSEELNNETFHLSSFYRKIDNWTNYKCILSDPITDMRLYKRIKNPAYILLDNVNIAPVESSGMYVELLDYKLPSRDEFNSVQITVEATASLPSSLLTLNLIQDIVDTDPKPTNYVSTLFHWYFGMKKNYAFNFTRNLDLTDASNKTLKFYFYNPEMGIVKMTDINIKIFGISKTQH